MTTPTRHDVPETDVRESNPNGAGPHGLEGDMGISSERTGPLGSSPATVREASRSATADRRTGRLGDGIEGTGSHGSASYATDGVLDSTPDAGSPTTMGTEPGEVPREHPDAPAEGADPDEDQPEQERTSTEDPAEGPTSRSSGADSTTGVDRTVGEPQPDPVANKHEFDPDRNPRH